MITSQIVEKEEDFFELRKEWDDILNRSKSNEFFLTWEWLFCWWESFQKTCDRLCIVLIKDDNEVVGIAPFMLTETNYYGFKLRKLCFIGEGPSDRADVIVAKNDPEIFSELMRCVYTQISECDIIYLREIPENSGFLKYVETHCHGVNIETDSKCPYVPIDADMNWESFHKSLSKKLKRDFANKNNILARLGNYKYEHINEKIIIDSNIEKVRQIESMSFKANGNYELSFDLNEKRRFQKRVIEGAGENYEVLLSFLKLNDQIIAYLYGFIYNRKYHAYNMAYLPDYVRVSPGKLLMNETIKWVIEGKYKEFDFLRGESYVKGKWSKSEKKNSLV